MRKETVLALLFFSCLWGASEVILGELLRSARVPHSSVPLTVVAFAILAVAKNYLPQRASATAIASIAMLFQVLSARFFACHFLAILLLGVSYDVCAGLLRHRSKAVLGLAATYAGYILFALLITYVVRYHFWTEAGFEKIARYVGISGTLAAVLNLVAVPAGHRFGQALRNRAVNPFAFQSGPVTGCVTLVTGVLWFLAIARLL
ncbi:MAG: hypothetical protein JXQ29_14400 [Planctomycetes bacterium]|nr:hypothetical protein [Planctomycetota bacterium]